MAVQDTCLSANTVIYVCVYLHYLLERGGHINSSLSSVDLEIVQIVPELKLKQTIKTDSAQSSSNKCKDYLLKIYSQNINFLNII